MKDNHTELNSRLCHDKENFEILLTPCKSRLRMRRDHSYRLTNNFPFYKRWIKDMATIKVCNLKQPRYVQMDTQPRWIKGLRVASQGSKPALSFFSPSTCFQQWQPYSFLFYLNCQPSTPKLKPFLSYLLTENSLFSPLKLQLFFFSFQPPQNPTFFASKPWAFIANMQVSWSVLSAGKRCGW